MNSGDVSSENAVAASIADLRTRFPRTQDLYREVCVLLFFRHGITPTANKLYQLVRKGSMAAPTEALNHFWTTLRERSRVTVEHADLPDELKTASGELVAALWKSAQAMSQDALAELRAEATIAVDAARAGETRAQEAQAAVLTELQDAHAKISTYEELAAQLRRELAACSANEAVLEARLEECRHQMADVQLRLDRSHTEHMAEREKLSERTQLAEQRFADMEKRALLETDRERTLSAKLQKTLESERIARTSAIERLRNDQNQAQVTIGMLREQISSLQSAVDTVTKEREREQADLQSTRVQLETAMRQAITDGLRADQLRQELERLSAISPVSAGDIRAAQPEQGKKRPRKRPSTS